MEPIFVQLGIALGPGLLVGLQRTWSDHNEAGIRTLVAARRVVQVGGVAILRLWPT